MFKRFLNWLKTAGVPAPPVNYVDEPTYDKLVGRLGREDLVGSSSVDTLMIINELLNRIERLEEAVYWKDKEDGLGERG